tara:strand:- start:82 stop:306 length:225 start_codon:yes stop_codon:yes gene_type:complete
LDFKILEFVVEELVFCSWLKDQLFDSFVHISTCIFIEEHQEPLESKSLQACQDYRELILHFNFSKIDRLPKTGL